MCSHFVPTMDFEMESLMDNIQEIHIGHESRNKRKREYVCDVSKLTSVELARRAVHKGLRRDEDIMEEIVCNGNLPVLQFLYSEGYPITYICLTTALYRGHMHLVDWVADIALPTIPLDEYDDRIEFLAWQVTHSDNRIVALQWMKDRGLAIPCSNITFATFHHPDLSRPLDLLKWLHLNTNGVVLDDENRDLAFTNGTLEMIAWLSDERFMSKSAILNEADRFHRDDITHWASNHFDGPK